MPGPYEALPVLGVGETISICNSLLSELRLQVEGEVANFSISRGKFVFFDLKDITGESRLGCFMMVHQLSTPLEDGMRIIVDAQAGLYVKSGQFRLTVQRIQLQGEGNLKRAFELLKAKLEKDGLFSGERKRQLPAYPGHIGIISSKDAAGYGDFMRIAEQRSCGLKFSLVHAAVQGIQAEQEIVAAFEYLNTYVHPEVIVLVRGGGSMEDLHAFNSEIVARAIVRSQAPVVVGVGHERDVTIADFCADVRAATPSNAAQIVVPDRDEIRTKLLNKEEVREHHVRHVIAQVRHAVQSTTLSLRMTFLQRIERLKSRVLTVRATIDALAPAGVLARGYSITKNAHGAVVTSTAQLAEGETVHTFYSEGSTLSTITSRT